MKPRKVIFGIFLAPMVVSVLIVIIFIIYVFIIQSIGYGLAKRFTNKKEK